VDRRSDCLSWQSYGLYLHQSCRPTSCCRTMDSASTMCGEGRVHTQGLTRPSHASGLSAACAVWVSGSDLRLLPRVPRCSPRRRSGARQPRHARAPKRSARGCGWPSLLLRGRGVSGRGGKAGTPIEPESRISEVAARTIASRSGSRLTAPTGSQFRVDPLQRCGSRRCASW
jgi:hypothetical protein